MGGVNLSPEDVKKLIFNVKPIFISSKFKVTECLGVGMGYHSNLSHIK